MDIFDVLTLVGGLCLFLFGMDLMGQALERRAGGALRSILGKLTTKRSAGFLTGLGVTAVVQSSSATTVMVVGFVNSGLMALSQAINVIMGANVGTTVTAWILSLSGIESDNVYVQLLKPTSFTPVLALIGIVCIMFLKKEKSKDTGNILLGFATLMFGMDTMSDAVSGLQAVPAFRNLFLMFENPILGVMAGALLTAIIQSSSASVGILQSLAQETGAITYGSAIPIIMGQNIGTCVTAMLSSVGANRNAKRAALVHLSFNILGTVVCLILFSILRALLQPAFLGDEATMSGIAICHSVFNVTCTIILMPMSKLLEKLAMTLIPEPKQPESVTELDERLLATPSIALERCHRVTADMARVAIETLNNGMASLGAYTPELAEKIMQGEERTDHFEDILGTYLVKLSSRQIGEAESAEAAKLLRMIGDFERISDHAANLLGSAEELKEKEIRFTAGAQKELDTVMSAVKECASLTLTAFLQNDAVAAACVEPLEQVVDELKEALRVRHIRRLQQGDCSIDAGFVWSDLLTNLERITDHCSNIAGCITDMEDSNLNLHESLREMRRDSAQYRDNYRSYAEKYKLA